MRWNYTLKCGKALRNAIHSGDSYETIEQLRRAYQELLDAGIIDEYDYESYTEDFDMYIGSDDEYDEYDDIEESIDYELGEFYDLCDNLGVWVDI